MEKQFSISSFLQTRYQHLAPTNGEEKEFVKNHKGEMLNINLVVSIDDQTGRPAQPGPGLVKPGPFWARPARHG
jgi:hypothetical protein